MSLESTKYTGPSTGTDKQTAARNDPHSATLENNCVYKGTIARVDPVARTCTISYNARLLTGAVSAMGSLGGATGASEASLPAVGTNVLFVYCDAPYIIGAFPAAMTPPQLLTQAATGGSKSDFAVTDKKSFKSIFSKLSWAPYSPGYTRPWDLWPGESSLETGVGPSIRMLSNFLQLNSGGAASLELHALNDLVCLTSNAYAHHSCLGDELSWSNGRTNREDHWTSYPHEAEGKMKEDEPLVGYSDGEVDLESVKDYNLTGRWRSSSWSGWLGDQFNWYISDPTPAKTTYAADAMRAGKARLFMGSDGQVLAQSTSDVTLEVCPRVVVPVVHNKWDNPIRDTQKLIERNSDQESLRTWGKGPNYDDWQVMPWQIRAQSRYAALFHSLARWRQMMKQGDVRIPTEAETPAPELTNKEDDREKANPENVGAHPQVYASIKIFPDGSVAIYEGKFASIVINQGNIHINSSRNVTISSSQTVAIEGKNIILKAANNIEMSAVGGGIRMKGRAYIDMLSELGRIWLKSDAAVDRARDEATAAANRAWDMSQDEFVKPEAVDFGVILDCPNGRVLVHGNEGVVTDVGTKEGHLIMQNRGTGDIRVVAKQQLKVYGLKVYVRGTQEMGIAAAAIGFKSPEIKLGDAACVSGTMFKASMLIGKFISATGALSGPKREAQQHVNHVGVVSPSLDAELTTPVADVAREVAQELKDGNKEPGLEWNLDAEFDADEWTYIPESHYCIGSAVLGWKSLKAPFAYDDFQAGGETAEKFRVWTNASTHLLSNTRTKGTSYPYPGENAKMFVFTKQTPVINRAWGEDGGANTICTAGDMTAKPVVRLLSDPDKDDVEPLKA